MYKNETMAKKIGIQTARTSHKMCGYLKLLWSTQQQQQIEFNQTCPLHHLMFVRTHRHAIDAVWGIFSSSIFVVVFVLLSYDTRMSSMSAHCSSIIKSAYATQAQHIQT